VRILRAGGPSHRQDACAGKKNQGQVFHTGVLL
jgi:hypothetical protein